MTKRNTLMISVVIATILLGGCGHEHTWIDATCTAPATCAECGKTEGEANGHKWVEATCTVPKTCSVCGETEGETSAHDWNEATCTEPKICKVCGATEGEPLGHTTEVGVCPICGEVANPDILMDLGKRTNEITSVDVDAMFDGNTVDEFYYGCMNVYDDIVKGDKEIQRIIDDYKDYDELSVIIKAMKDVVNSEPAKPTRSGDSIKTFWDDCGPYCVARANLYETMASELKRLSGL